MARKVILEDDLTGEVIQEGEGGTVTFSLRGEHYQLDLSDKSQAKLEKALEPFISRATKVAAPQTAPAHSVKAAPKRSASTDREQLQAMREWLRGQGHDVSDRGRIAQNLQDLYNAAH